MAQGQLDAVLKHIRKLVRAPEASLVTDRSLLERFAAGHEESAFAALVERHGPMVLGVCRRVLRNEHDAEDAFQATFIVLARKARSLHWRESVGAWLYAVACRVARKARAVHARRQFRERQVEVMPSPDPISLAADREIQALLDEELCRLPEKYRLPVVLCCLEGRSRSQAARQLGWKEGTVAGRLARGRTLLQKRLARRGITVPAGLLAAVLAKNLATAAMPAVLMHAAIRPACLVAAGQLTTIGLTAGPAATLAKEVLRAMLLTKMKITTAVLAMTLVATGTGMLAHETLMGQHNRRKQEAGPKSVAMVAGEPALPSREGEQPTSEYSKELAQDARTGAQKKQIYPATLPERFRLPQPEEAVALEFSPDGAVLAAYGGLNDHHINLWDTVTGDLIGRLEVKGQGVNSRPFAFSPDGKILAVVQLGQSSKVMYYDPVTGKAGRTLAVLQPGPVGPVLLRFSMDGKLLAVAVEADKAVVLDSVTGNRVQEVANPSHHTIFAMEFSPDGKRLALGTADDPSLQLWDLATGKRLDGIEQRPKDGIVTSLAFSRDGRFLAAGRCNRIVISEVTSGRERGRLEAPMGLVNGVAFTPDGKMLISASQDGKARIWDLSSQRVRYMGEGGAEGRSMALGPDATALALGTTRHAIVWAVPFANHILPVKDANLTAADMEKLWPALVAQDSQVVHQAVRQMIAAPDRTVSLLSRHLEATRAMLQPNAEASKQLRRLIAELDSDSFERRVSATRELERMGSQAEVLLRQALAAGPSAETRARLEQVLKKIGQPSIQASRAIRILEYIGTPATQHLFERLACGPAEARLTQDAQAALNRLAQRRAAVP